MNASVRIAVRARHGFNLLEVVISTLLVSVVLLGATNMMAGVVRGRGVANDRARADMMVEQMLDEILALPFHDPENAASDNDYLGPETSEYVGNRSGYDDVDDYNGWSKNPPESKAGQPYEDLKGWTRRVVVEHVKASEPSAASTTRTGAKRIHVSIDDGAHTLAEAWSLRTQW
ncbi:MAG: prepilin-type N-terminal cleavage/methylation domain-containing protein [Planctomycetales bacterium]|nr:prepilin-type N-terminal cleavage/methylation domain-containing protein [Planctomycetales bacterium]